MSENNLPDAEKDAVSHGPDNPCEPKCHGWGIGCPCNPRSAEKDAGDRRQFIIEAVTEGLLLADVLTGNDEGTPSMYYVHPEDVQYLVKTVLDFADSTAAQMGWTRPIPPAKRDDWHEFDEDVNDASMCMCGVPALYHDSAFPPAGGSA